MVEGPPVAGVVGNVPRPELAPPAAARRSRVPEPGVGEARGVGAVRADPSAPERAEFGRSRFGRSRGRPPTLLLDGAN